MPRPELMPPRLAERPRFRGLPIPYATPTDEEGVPQFRANNEMLRIKCIRERICAMCGYAIGTWVAFIGSDEELENGVFHEPPMHQDCAEYSRNVCPYLASPKYVVKPQTAFPGERTVTIFSESTPRQPGMVLYITGEYRAVMYAGALQSRVAPPRKVRHFD